MKLLVGNKETEAEAIRNKDSSISLVLTTEQPAGHVVATVQDQQARPYLVGDKHPSSSAPAKPAQSREEIVIPAGSLKDLAEECCAALSAITGLDVCIAYREPVTPETQSTGGSHEQTTLYYRGN